MKKFIATTTLVSLVFSSSLFALALDEKSIKISFEGYKTPAMIGTRGGFSKAQFHFNKDASSLSKQLTNASITLSPKDIDMGGVENQVIADNLVNYFFAPFNNKGDIKVTIGNVIEGESKGTISAKVTIGNQSTLVPLMYVITGNNDFEARGQLDLSAFTNAQKALKALSDAVPEHQNVSWNIVNLTINGKLK
ncbi:MAG: hypothetical protein J1E31_01615 [Helicobacter sp.]|nr:hypothetical protein [Helicobacter sp.]